MQFGKVTSFALDLLYPRRCPICHEPAPAGKKICPACRKKLPYIETKRCRKCGKPVEDREIMCEDCKKTEHVYTAGIGVFRYDETMRGTISYYKFKITLDLKKSQSFLLKIELALKIKFFRHSCV